MLCLRDPQSPALEQGPAPSLLVFRRSQLCLLYTLAPRKQQMARLLLAPPHGSPHPRRLCQRHLAPLQTPWLSFLVSLLGFFLRPQVQELLVAEPRRCPSSWLIHSYSIHRDHEAPCTVRAQRAPIILGVRRGRMRRGEQAVGLCSLPPVSARGQSRMPALPTARVSPWGGCSHPLARIEKLAPPTLSGRSLAQALRSPSAKQGPRLLPRNISAPSWPGPIADTFCPRSHLLEGFLAQQMPAN